MRHLDANMMIQVCRWVVTQLYAKFVSVPAAFWFLAAARSWFTEKLNITSRDVWDVGGASIPGLFTTAKPPAALPLYPMTTYPALTLWTSKIYS
jgi:hypothetical protein